MFLQECEKQESLLIKKLENIFRLAQKNISFHICVPDKIHTIMNVSIPLLLHGDLKAAVQDLVERVDPILHLPFAVRSQQVGALILHLKLESKPPNLVVLLPQPRRRLDNREKKEKGD